MKQPSCNIRLALYILAALAIVGMLVGGFLLFKGFQSGELLIGIAGSIAGAIAGMISMRPAGSPDPQPEPPSNENPPPTV